MVIAGMVIKKLDLGLIYSPFYHSYFLFLGSSGENLWQFYDGKFHFKQILWVLLFSRGVYCKSIGGHTGNPRKYKESNQASYANIFQKHKMLIMNA